MKEKTWFRFHFRSSGLFSPMDSDSDSDSNTDSCTMQNFSTGSDSDSEPLIEMYVRGTEVCPWDRDQA